MMEMTNADFASHLNQELKLFGHSEVTPNVVRQWVAWDVLPRATAHGRTVGMAPKWSRSSTALRRAMRLAELRQRGIKRENALIVQAYIEWGHRDFERVQVAFAKEWAKVCSQLSRRQTTFLDGDEYSEVSATKKRAIANQLGELDYRLKGTQFEQSPEVYAALNEYGRSPESASFNVDHILNDVVNRIAPDAKNLLPAELTDAFRAIFSGLTGLPDETDVSGVDVFQSASERDFRIARHRVRLCLKALEGKLQKSASLSHPALELIVRKLQSFGPQLRVAPWIILPFIQALKTPFPK